MRNQKNTLQLIHLRAFSVKTNCRLEWLLLLQFFRVMDNILQGLKHVCVYLDNILITGATEEEHLQNLDTVLARLESAGMTVKCTKCAFLLPTVEYLGHKISAQHLQPMEEKIRAINKAPAHTNISQLKSFLRLINYYCKFLPNLSNTLAFLYRLLQKNTT